MKRMKSKLAALGITRTNSSGRTRFGGSTKFEKTSLGSDGVLIARARLVRSSTDCVKLADGKQESQ
jgi:hypothetical protein